MHRTSSDLDQLVESLCMPLPVQECPLHIMTLNVFQMLEVLKRKIPKSPLTYFLFCVFGIGSWIAINGIWAEISILVITTPECEKLPAQLVIIIQVANVGPLIYTVMKYLLSHFNKQHHFLKLEIVTTTILILIGIFACVLLSFFWNVTLVSGDNAYSVCLYLLAFLLALVDCTSSVVFIPFMKHFSSEYLSALYIGEGLSGLLPSLFALTQGSVDNNIQCIGNYTGRHTLGIRFSPNVYFIFLGGMMLISGISFLSINTLSAVKKQRINYSKLSTSINNQDKTNVTDTSGKQDNQQCSQTTVQFSLAIVCNIIWSNIALFACLLSLNFLTNGALSAVSSYAFLPYGNDVYHITINLALLMNPLMSFLFLMVSSKSKVITVVTTTLVIIMGIYVIVMAQCPVPAFQTHTFAKIVMVSYHPYPHPP